jgi:hypothetical protein
MRACVRRKGDDAWRGGRPGRARPTAPQAQQACGAVLRPGHAAHHPCHPAGQRPAPVRPKGSFAERRNGRAINRRPTWSVGRSAACKHHVGTQESYLSGGLGVAWKVGRNASRMEGSTELEAPRRATWKALDGPCCSSSAGTRATTTGPFTESILIDDDWDLLSSRADVTSSMAKSSSSSTCGSECSVVPNEYNTVTKRSANTGANRRGTPTGYSRAGLRTRETRAHLPA